MEKLGIFVAPLGMLVLTAVLLAWPTMWLWNNALIGAIDGINPIGFWQAMGITFLSNGFFKGTSNSK
jgi:hypothetical protein